MSDAAAPAVDPSNADQARDWDGEDGRYWADHHASFEGLLAAFDPHLVGAANLAADDMVLEIGCGTGATTRVLAVRVPAGRVVAVDLSGPMLELARTGASEAGLGNVDFMQADAQVHAFPPKSVDAAVSRCGCMFFGDPAAAFANIGQALRPGGRIALVVWQAEELNEWITKLDEATTTQPAEGGGAPESADPVESLPDYEPGPFSLADPARCIGLLEGAGFIDVALSSLTLPLRIGATVDEAFEFCSTWITDEDPEVVAAAETRLRDLLSSADSGSGVFLGSATWLVTAQRPA